MLFVKETENIHKKQEEIEYYECKLVNDETLQADTDWRTGDGGSAKRSRPTHVHRSYLG